MKSALKNRALATSIVTLVAAAMGMGVGSILGFEIMLRMGKTRLDQYAQRLVSAGNVAAAEAGTVLAAMNASKYPFCSDAEITYFRSLIFQSEYLKDAGRIRDGKVVCSGKLGRMKNTSVQSDWSILFPNGLRLYKNLEPFRIGNLSVPSTQSGDSFVVCNAEIERQMGEPPMYFSMTMLEPHTQQPRKLVSTIPPAKDKILTREGVARLGGDIYATRCTLGSSACVTTYIAVSEVARMGRNGFAVAVALGGLIGGCFGLCCSILWSFNKGLARQLRRAIRAGKLQMVYQPVVELATRRIVGAEALARWTDEYGSVVGPDVFVRIAEERGFVGELTRLVVRTVLREFGEILRTHPDFYLGINVTASDLADPGFLPMLNYSVDRSGGAPRSLVIEITESSTARHEMAIETTRQLRQQGYRVAIDDFGTGYSNLSYLHELSIDSIKIDRVFTHAIGTEAVTLAILPQIRALATSLNLEIVVEGIETEEQACCFAGENRPIYAQGWLFGRPVPAAEFHLLLVPAEEEKKALLLASVA